MSEKKLPTYDLEAFKATCSSVERLVITGTAISNAASLGFAREDIVEVIRTMERSHFYKSMTSYADHTVWQDVYHVPSNAGNLYVKFTSDPRMGFRLLSFKEKDNG